MLTDHDDADVSSQPALAALNGACRRAIDRHVGTSTKTAIEEDTSPLPGTALLPPGGVSIAYLIMGHRPYANVTISRLVRVLWHPAHLFLVHLDARTDKSVEAALRERFVERFAQYRNVRLLQQRHAVGWGAFSMVEVLLTSLSVALAAAPFDFFINLSDADVALRTAAELGRFLGGFRGRSFVAIKYPQADAMRYHAHAHMRRSTWLECEGEGFVVINESAADFFGGHGRRCCYARSGPIVYARLPLARPAAPDGYPFYHGSQWALLARNAVEWLVRDPAALALARHLRFTYMADETFVQTALMGSPLRASLVNHNLRYIDWPHGYGDPSAYWHSVGAKHVAGPMLLTERTFGRVVGSAALFARKVDLEAAPGRSFLHRWDGWMAAKLRREKRRRATTTTADAHAADDDALLAAARQPPIAAPLLAEDPSLHALRPPLTPEERERLSATQSPEELARLEAPRAVHFGHEDLMAKQFEQSAPAPTAPAVGEGAAPMVTESDEWLPTRPQPIALEAAVHDAEPPPVPETVRVARMVFSDGSSCSCAAWCGDEGEPCCAEWQGTCAREFGPR